jgi:hypothetical protein
MIVDTGEVEVKDVGYAVGLVEASFSFTQFFSRTYSYCCLLKPGRRVQDLIPPGAYGGGGEASARTNPML